MNSSFFHFLTDLEAKFDWFKYLNGCMNSWLDTRSKRVPGWVSLLNSTSNFKFPLWKHCVKFWNTHGHIKSKWIKCSVTFYGRMIYLLNHLWKFKQGKTSWVWKHNLLHILLMTCKTHSAVLTNTLGVQFITKKLLEYKNNIQTEGWSYFDP